MKRIPIGRKLYIEVISVFLIFAATFIVYQHMREKQYKIDTLDLRLQNYKQFEGIPCLHPQMHEYC